MSKKVLAVILTLVMILGCAPVAAFAESADTVTADERVAAWKENLTPVLEQLIGNQNSTHWKYVAENNEELANTMLTYTVFALYDDAWKNGFDKSVSIDAAEKILASLVEKIDANIGDSKFSEILKVLQTASDANDLIQKVNGYVKISDTLTSEGWTKTFKAINTIIKIGNYYEKNRDKIIEAYARLLSVQAANEFYRDFLAYTASITDYSVVVTACNNLINDIDTSIDAFLQDELLKVGAYTTSQLLTTAARLAMESNAYTAVALKVYDVGTSVADVFWNTGDQYALMDQLYTTFYVETAASEYARIAALTDDASLYQFAIGALLALRNGGAETLYNLKLAQNKGLVGMVKDQINYNVTITEAAELAFLDLATDVLFGTDTSSYVPVSAVIQFCTPADVIIGSTTLYGITAQNLRNSDGFFSVVANKAAGTFIKTGFAVSGLDVKVLNDEDTLATAIVSVPNTEIGVVEEYSFTTMTVGPERTIEFNTAFADGYEFTYTVEGEPEVIGFNTVFVYPAYNAVTVSSVATAIGNVARDEATAKVLSIGELLRTFFDNLTNALRNIFANIKLKKS